MAQLELTNQKISRMGHESSSKKSDVEKFFKNQISELEVQLQEVSRSNHDYKQQAEELDQIVRESQQDLSTCKIDLDRARLET